MKKYQVILLVAGILFVTSLRAQELSPFFKVTVPGDPSALSSRVEELYGQAGFELAGAYHPGGEEGLYVMVFTRNDLKRMTFSLPERGALASVLKVGLMRQGQNTEVSVVNPIYVFYAYLRENVRDYTPYRKISDDFVKVLASLGQTEPFGEKLDVSKLKKYHYMMGMPYFDDPVKLRTFDSFEQGLSVIRSNLSAGKGHTVKVFEVVDKEKNTAVFGVGLQDPEKGEQHFLPIIGESHLAALPYEIILSGKEATMLHGRFRFALYWPGLTMRTFTRIMSTPGDVEETLKGLTQ